VARKYGTSANNIKAWNSLRTSQIRPGQRLIIWQEARPYRAAHKPGKKAKYRPVKKKEHKQIASG
jgi:LysM repeat protein